MFLCSIHWTQYGIYLNKILAANGFFANGNRVTEAGIANGDLDGFFQRMETTKWPTTLHCDLGCDQYDSVPWEQGSGERVAHA